MLNDHFCKDYYKFERSNVVLKAPLDQIEFCRFEPKYTNALQARYRAFIDSSIRFKFIKM